ncbi:TlpA disulfide reductase family protein [Flavobacterium notoginsengisoli]|uniref:TlpA disulfide reductase family protein n=1 Tax=Flavobacterium notoginsengisoli TaxID=1478199 RepID=UPI00363219CD
MKKIYILLFFAVVSNLFSQNGKIYLKNPKFKIGAENTYVYEPAQGIVIKENYKASIIDSYYDSQTQKLVKKGKNYEFTAKVADSARTLIVMITNAQEIIDNNKDQGYVVYLKTQNASELGKTLASEIAMGNFANYFLKLKIDLKPEAQVAAYEKLFEKYPDLKSDKSYMSYLYQKSQINKEESNKEALVFAEKCLKKNTEEDDMLANDAYSMNRMSDEKAKLEKEILTKYPSGKLAKNQFINRFFAKKDKTEDYILKCIDTCKTKYKEESKGTLGIFYNSLMNQYLTDKDFEKAQKIESKVNDPAGIYNDFAWGLTGEDLTSPIKDMDFTSKISKRSLNLLEENAKESFNPQYQFQFNMYADTYALILYKQGNYEEAFKYQDSVRKANGFDAGGKERYVAMMEKVKSKNEVRTYLENEISTNTVTPALVSKLKEIYIAENLPLADFEKLKAKADQLNEEERNKKIIEQFGGKTPTDFALKNIEGKEVKLSDYRGKIVVLDFWATWCGPCKASFPKMQELVNKYKDKDVTFLFINTWENKKDDEVLKNVKDYLTEKKYTFNVVFDSKSEVVTNYKIQGIPTSILIGKDGNILFAGHSNSNLGELIDAQLK